MSKDEIIVDLSGTSDSDLQVTVDIDVAQPDTLPKGTRLNADGTISVTLGQSVVVKTKSSDGTITEVDYGTLTLRRFTGADLRAIRHHTGDAQTIETYARAARIKAPVMSVIYDRMLASDITTIGKVIEYFLENGPTTGQ